MGLSQMAMPKGSCLQANAMLLSPQNCSNKSKSNQNVLRRNLHTSYITIPLQQITTKSGICININIVVFEY